MTVANKNGSAKQDTDALDKFHCFGSRWFCLQMQEAFNAQSVILREIGQKHANLKFERVLPLIFGLQTTSEAVSLLRRDGLLSEAHVLMRLLTERALNLCYLLVAPVNENFEATTEASNKNPAKSQKEDADALIQFAKEFQFKESYDSEALETKIRVIAAKTAIPHDFLRLTVATHYPQASLALSGSPFGAIFHLRSMTPEADDQFSESLTPLLFCGLSLLNYVITLLGGYGIPHNLVKESVEATDKATELMLKIRDAVEPNVQDTYGWWQNLSDLEHSAGTRLAPLLREFETGFAACVEAGMQVPTIASTAKSSLKLRICALYLKRMLNDMRSVWIMMSRGNTSQAGSIAASLFESALLIQCLAENDTRAMKFSNKPSEAWPWSKRSMCEFVIQDEAKRENKKPNPRSLGALYAHYSWLCEIKHPTLSYTTHDSGSTQVQEKGYAVMPFPDVRDADWPVKRKIMLISLHNAIAAVKAFARGGNVQEFAPNEISFAAKVRVANEVVVKFLKAPTG